MDEHESSSSTGLIIGIVIGGVVVALLVLGGLGAMMWFFVGHAAHEDAVAVHEMHEAAEKLEMAVQDLDAAVKEVAPPLAPQPEPALAVRKRLVGVWEAKTFDEGQLTLELHDDGAMHLSALQPDAKKLDTKGRWEVLEINGDVIKLRRTAADNTDLVQDIRFENDNRFMIQGPRGGTVYTRQVK